MNACKVGDRRPAIVNEAKNPSSEPEQGENLLAQ